MTGQRGDGVAVDGAAAETRQPLFLHQLADDGLDRFGCRHLQFVVQVRLVLAQN